VIYTSTKFEFSNQLNGCVYPLIKFGHSGMSKINRRHGLALNHTVGKTLNNGRVNTFAIQRTEDPVACPVRALEGYVSEAGRMGVDLSLGYLFRPVGKSRSALLEECLSYSVVYMRVKFYLRAVGLEEVKTPHSLRRGCAGTMSLSGAADQAERVMGHVGWFTNKSLERYIVQDPHS
jgi:hypothetical protein